MCVIRKCAVENAEKIMIDKVNWGYDEYKNEVYLQLSYDDEGINVKFTVNEKNPRREEKEHLNPVHLDSCVEFFVNFTPKTSNHYINFETNANGTMNVSYRTDRYNSQNLELFEIESFNITPAIYDEYWTVSYKIGFSFIKKYYKDFQIDNCDYIIGNIYKCGEGTDIQHFLSHFKVNCETPDFHRPEYFGKIKIEK